MTITHFAPAGRCSAAEVEESRQRLLNAWPVEHLLECFPGPVVVLNGQRQIVLASEKFCRLAGKPLESLIGLRPGEAIGCIRAGLEEGGCGTTRFCRYCGAARAILQSQNSGSAVEECRMIRRMAEGDSALDLRVWATRIQLGEPYTVFALLDISDEKRRAVLERIFFHDLLNVVSGLSGLIELECDPDNGQDGDLRGLTREVVGELIEQIRAGRDLTAAERGDLNVRLEVIDAAGFLWSLGERYRRTSLAVNRRIIVSPAPCALFVWSDRVLLSRVLGNLVKNALEASLPGEVVTMRAESGAGGVSVSIHNPSAIPQAVEAQLFQRSFSTKGGQGRGIGLYSVKLLTERYLGGSVSFSSSPEKGTTFTVTLPAAAAAA